MARTDTERAALRARVRELVIEKPFSMQLAPGEASAVDALLDALLELVLQNIHDAGGFCDYEWHISGADFGGFFVRNPNVCQACGKTREQHTLHPVLLCPDELEHVQQLDKDQRR